MIQSLCWQESEKRAASLASLGIQTIEDLLTYYPFRYEDIQERNLNEIQDQEKVTLKGIVVSPPVMNRFGYKKPIAISYDART